MTKKKRWADYYRVELKVDQPEINGERVLGYGWEFGDLEEAQREVEKHPGAVLYEVRRERRRVWKEAKP